MSVDVSVYRRRSTWGYVRWIWCAATRLDPNNPGLQDICRSIVLRITSSRKPKVMVRITERSVENVYPKNTYLLISKKGKNEIFIEKHATQPSVYYR